MRLRDRLSSLVQSLSWRAGYPIVPRWRLAKWDHASHLRALLAMLEIDQVLDVGANVGQFREFLRLQVGYARRVVSFEPVGEVFTALEAAAAGRPEWSVHRLALGEADTVSTMNVMRERTLSSLLMPNAARLDAMGYRKYLEETRIDRTEVVTIRRLDSVIDRFVPRRARVFLKCDTQGYDLSVVRGASGCLDRVLALQVELPVREVYQGAPDYLRALPELTALGYELTGLFPVQRDATLRVINLDAVLIRQDEAERLRAAHRHAPGHVGRP